MSIADYYESGEQKQNKSHLENLISVALVDGYLDDSEKTLLAKFASRLSIDESTFNEMLKGADKYTINPPVDREKRYKRLYNLISVALADELVDDKEMKLIEKYVIGLGFSEKQAPDIINKILKFVTDKVNFEEAYEKL